MKVRKTISNSILVLGMFASLVLINEIFAEEIEIQHIETIKVTSSANWYSYNFVICADDVPINVPIIHVISDIEQKVAHTESNVMPGHCISFGIMIHASDANSIYTEFEN